MIDGNITGSTNGVYVNVNGKVNGSYSGIYISGTVGYVGNNSSEVNSSYGIY